VKAPRSASAVAILHHRRRGGVLWQRRQAELRPNPLPAARRGREVAAM